MKTRIAVMVIFTMAMALGLFARPAATKGDDGARAVARAAEKALEAQEALHAEVAKVLKNVQSSNLSARLSAAMEKGNRADAIRVIKEAGATGKVQIQSMSRQIIIVIICHGDHCHIIVIDAR